VSWLSSNATVALGLAIVASICSLPIEHKTIHKFKCNFGATNRVTS
jgi:hypothetical protein